MDKYSEVVQFLKDKKEKQLFIGVQIELFRKKFVKYLGCHDAMVDIRNIVFDQNKFSFEIATSFYYAIPPMDQIEEQMIRTLVGEYKENILINYSGDEYYFNEEESVIKLIKKIYESFFAY